MRQIRHVNIARLDDYPLVYQVDDVSIDLDDPPDDLRELDNVLDKRGVWGLWSESTGGLVALVFNEAQFDAKQARAWIEEHQAQDAGDVPVTPLKEDAGVGMGGPGSGNWGHAGRPGQVGGSMPRGAAMSIKSGKDWKKRYKAKTGREYKARKTKETEDAGPNVARGHTTKAFSNDTNTQFEFETAVVDLNSLIPSNTDKGGINPAYDQALQPRERSRAASQAQITQMANNLTPEALVWDFHQLDKGAPIIGEDMMVESGNGRTLALRRAMQSNPERWAAYQKTLRENLEAQGIDPDQVAGIENPVLVRIRKSQVDREKFAQEANSAAVLQMSPVEKAAQDARNLTSETLAAFDMKEGWSIDTALRRASNRPFVRRFMQTIPKNEQANLQRSDGSLNRMGLWRAKAAIFMTVFPGSSGRRLANTFFESLDSNIKNFENAVSDIMPKLAQAENLISSGRRNRNLSLAEDISKAVDMLARLKEQGVAPRDYVRQTSMFGRELNGTQERLLVAFDDMSRSRKSIRQVMNTYASEVINAPDPAQGTMFGGIGLTRDQLVDRVLEAANAN